MIPQRTGALPPWRAHRDCSCRRLSPELLRFFSGMGKSGRNASRSDKILIVLCVICACSIICLETMYFSADSWSSVYSCASSTTNKSYPSPSPVFAISMQSRSHAKWDVGVLDHCHFFKAWQKNYESCKVVVVITNSCKRFLDPLPLGSRTLLLFMFSQSSWLFHVLMLLSKHI